MEIETSRAIAAQILRHRSFVFQEFSQRYAQVNDFMYYEARRQDTKNRQNSINDLSQEDQDWFKYAQQRVWETADEMYETALQKGIAKECARMLLPLNTKTTIYMTGNIRSWIHYCQLRCEKSTQFEHRQIADECWKILRELTPNVTQAIETTEQFLKEIK